MSFVLEDDKFAKNPICRFQMRKMVSSIPNVEMRRCVRIVECAGIPKFIHYM